MPERIRVGVIGWNYPEWKGLVYPRDAKPAEFLREYAKRFPIVEAATGTYGLPRTSVVEKWAADVPDGFEVSIKLPEWLLKKDPREEDFARAVGVILDHAEPLARAGKLGTLVAQFPPWFRYDASVERLRAFVDALPVGPRWAVELRHDSWWREETYETLKRARVTLAWSALGGDARTPAVRTTDALYLRLFGDREFPPPYAEKRRDATDELAYWAERIREEGADAERVDALVSKYLEGYAPATAATLSRMLGVPPPDLRAERGARQATLF